MFSIFKKKPKKVSLLYNDFSLVYSEGTSLINRIKQYGEFEPETIQALKAVLAKYTDPIFLDIGANIGLISLGVYKNIGNGKIYAFEPGKHQYDLFLETIHINNLSKIILSPYALSNTTGQQFFYVHNTKDVSGDGFTDTLRAGKTKRVIVNTVTLDEWWKTANEPKIDCIKMDTEGSEFLILQGAITCIKKCKPIICLEINSINIKSYKHTIDDVLNKLAEFDYSLLTLDFKPIHTLGDKIYLQYDTFMAIPNEKVAQFLQ